MARICFGSGDGWKMLEGKMEQMFNLEILGGCISFAAVFSGVSGIK